jgi:uncharacterized coiled-coil DUF342 family protein
VFLRRALLAGAAMGDTLVEVKGEIRATRAQLNEQLDELKTELKQYKCELNELKDERNQCKSVTSDRV